MSALNGGHNSDDEDSISSSSSLGTQQRPLLLPRSPINEVEDGDLSGALLFPRTFPEPDDLETEA